MKQFSNIAILGLKKWFRILSKEEDQELIGYEDEINQIDRKRVVDTFNTFDAIETDKAWQHIVDSIAPEENKTSPKTVSLLRPMLKYVAIFALFAFGIYYYNTQDIFTETQLLPEAQNKLEISTVTLKTADNLLLTFNSGGEQLIKNNQGVVIAKQKGNELHYLKDIATVQDSKDYHELKVPNGQNFRVSFSDGTKVYCDAGTSLKYRSGLNLDYPRNVSLVGRAFFDVAKNKKNPFTVTTHDSEISVLGTQFNVSAYPENSSTQTVLVEGVVKVTSKNTKEKVLLVPNQKAFFSTETNTLVVNEVNTYTHTAWMSQKIIFNKILFKDVLKSLERKFGVIITNENDELNGQTFTAKFDTESLEEILNAFKEESDFTFKINQNQVTIQ
ncbi:FecR family protein [uncultured Croceitalea sp.]|uniref:FecR family protein n=1 Tax=uncultured Croceitalea sp. TaxID=1798908 RepID=UPI00374E54E9